MTAMAYVQSMLTPSPVLLLRQCVLPDTTLQSLSTNRNRQSHFLAPEHKNFSACSLSRVKSLIAPNWDHGGYDVPLLMDCGDQRMHERPLHCQSHGDGYVNSDSGALRPDSAANGGNGVAAGVWDAASAAAAAATAWRHPALRRDAPGAPH